MTPTDHKSFIRTVKEVIKYHGYCNVTDSFGSPPHLDKKVTTPEEATSFWVKNLIKKI